MNGLLYMQSFTCGFFPWAEWWCPHHWGESWAEAALACQPHITSVWFNEQWSNPVWPSLLGKATVQVSSSGSSWTLAHAKRQPLQMLTWLWGKNEVSVSASHWPGQGTSSWARLLHSEPKTHCITAIDFHHEGYLLKPEGPEKHCLVAENVGLIGKERRDLTEDKNLSTHLELKHFCFLLCSANWETFLKPFLSLG